MTHHRWHPVPILLVVAGVLAACTAAVVNREALGWWQALIYAGAALALAALFWFRRQLSQTEVELDSLRSHLTEEEKRLREGHARLEELRRAAQAEVEQQTLQLDKREQSLASRLGAFHEWMEFPQPVNLTRPPTIEEAIATDKELAELARKDRQLMFLLKAETKVLYQNILSNKYAPDGQVNGFLIRDDLYELIGRVARLYRPGVEHPLLEASLSQIIRAANRACLQLLVVLDDLPINVKDRNINSLYTYVRNAVSAWQMYKSTEPYWPYVNTAYYLGRVVLGANPYTLGAWWFLSSLSKRGATRFATNLVNRQALAMLGNVVRVIGYEVAGIFGGDFRHRDANWIYGAELSELLVQFPLSRDSLSHALREVGVLELRSEYDRVFLYRCLTSQVSARPQQYQAKTLLTSEEREAIASRLEKFLGAHVHGKSADRVQKWKQAVEDRLGIKMTVGLKPTAHSVREQVVDALHSLASFVIGVKQLEPADLQSALAGIRVLAELPAEERQSQLAALAENPPYFFEHPDIDPDSDLASLYLEDLAALQARLPPRDPQGEEALVDVAGYLRREPKFMRGLIEKQYVAELADRFAADAPGRKASAEVARAVLDLLEGGEQARFLYGSVTLEWPADEPRVREIDQPLWLLGAGSRLVLFSTSGQSRVLWRGDETVQIEQSRNLLSSTCRLLGGQWLVEPPAPVAIRIPAGLITSYTAYFRPLEEMLSHPGLHPSSTPRAQISPS